MSVVPQIYNFFTVKYPVKKMEKQATDWKKLFVTYITDNVLLSRKYKELSKLSIKEGRRQCDALGSPRAVFPCTVTDCTTMYGPHCLCEIPGVRFRGCGTQVSAKLRGASMTQGRNCIALCPPGLSCPPV